jgi:hypothetical protein
MESEVPVLLFTDGREDILEGIKYYVGKSISKLQMHIELKQTRVLIWKTLLFHQHNLPGHWGTCPIVSQAPENQQHKILWAAVGTRRWLPWSGESWSLPLNGLTKFPEDVTVGVSIYGLSLRPECGEQYAFVIQEDCEHQFPGGWCHLKLLFGRRRRMFPLHWRMFYLGLVMVNPRW